MRYLFIVADDEAKNERYTKNILGKMLIEYHYGIKKVERVIIFGNNKLNINRTFIVDDYRKYINDNNDYIIVMADTYLVDYDLLNDTENSLIINDSMIIKRRGKPFKRIKSKRLYLYNYLAIYESIKKKNRNNAINNGALIYGDVTIDSNSFIEFGAKIYGGIIVNSHIRKAVVVDSIITNSYIGADVTILKSTIFDSIVTDNCKIGPFSFLRNHTFIANGVKIGAFVDIKKTYIGLNSKVSHLAYLGDTLCKDNVNFSCGAITCNYDGKRKYKTIINDGAFIGCNTNLVAPIVIGRNSYIACGTTVTHDIEDDSFVIGRMRETEKKKQANKYKM